MFLFIDYLDRPGYQGTFLLILLTSNKNCEAHEIPTTQAPNKIHGFGPYLLFNIEISV